MIPGPIVRARDRLLGHLSTNVYGPLLELEGEPPPELRSYLAELWDAAPLQLAGGHTAAACVIYVSPLLFGHGAIFAKVDAAERERIVSRMLRSPLYAVRLLAQAAKTAALTAAMRNTGTRAELLGPRARGLRAVG